MDAQEAEEWCDDGPEWIWVAVWIALLVAVVVAVLRVLRRR
jgi:hypothetical protein